MGINFDNFSIKRKIQYLGNYAFSENWTARHLAEMFSRCLKDLIFANIKCLTKALIRHLKKISKGHLRSIC